MFLGSPCMLASIIKEDFFLKQRRQAEDWARRKWGYINFDAELLQTVLQSKKGGCLGKARLLRVSSPQRNGSPAEASARRSIARLAMKERAQARTKIKLSTYSPFTPI